MKQKKILIVDDDKSIGEMLRTLLEFNQIEADVVSRPQDLDIPNIGKNFDLIILDLRLSGVCGTEICSKLKEEESTREIPVLMMSASNDVAKTCKDAGANDFISKPFEIDELLEKINTMVAG